MGPYLAQPNTEKHTNKGESFKTKLRYSFCQMQGWRRTMEDAAITEVDIGGSNSLFGVFDGHGGFKVCLKNIRDSFEKFEVIQIVDEIIESKEGQQQLKLIRKKNDSSSYNDNVISMSTGCTANVVLITPTKIFTANAGDSRSVLCRKGNATPLSFDHKPQNQTERKRIQNGGGQIINGRVNGGLNLSRSFGDFNYKRNKQKAYDEQLIICKPDVTQIARSPGNDEFIIIGCDGIWEKYVNDSQPLITRIFNQRKSGSDGVNILKNLLDFLLAKETSEEVGCDNMTAVLIEFI